MLNDNGILDLTLVDVQFFHARLSATIPLSMGRVNFLNGANGVGKSSLFEYLKHEQEFLFPFSTFFISQTPLDCLESMRGIDLKAVLETSFKQRFSHERFEQIIKILDPSQLILGTEVLNLSGGQAQFLKLAMGLSMKADFYFIDEPFNNIDQAKRGKLREFMLKSLSGFLVIDHFYDEWGINNKEHDSHELGTCSTLSFNCSTNLEIKTSMGSEL